MREVRKLPPMYTTMYSMYSEKVTPNVHQYEMLKHPFVSGRHQPVGEKDMAVPADT